MSNYLTFEEDQFVLSYEVLALFQWWAQQDPEALKRLVDKALKGGLGEALEKQHDLAPNSTELQAIVTDFFSLLELMIHEGQHSWKQEQEVAPNEPLSQTAECIDSTFCDDETVALSVAKTRAALKKNVNLNVQETLYREFLKRWTPRNKNVQH